MSTVPAYPTHHSEVNALLDEILAGAQSILGKHFVGMYLYGSLALGEFDESSDVDFLVVTDRELSDEMLSALKEMHLQIAAHESKWAMELEGSYIPQRALRRYDPANRDYPHLDRGESNLHVRQHEADWVVQRHVLREYGVTMTGPRIQTLIDPITPDDLRRAVVEILDGWWAPMVDVPSRLPDRGYQSYAVLTMCRMLYTLEFGTVVSKPVAARWAQETLGERWVALIERAWVGRRNPREKADPDDVKETMQLIRYTVEWSRQ